MDVKVGIDIRVPQLHEVDAFSFDERRERLELALENGERYHSCMAM